jgi:cytochrome c peroxidase
VDYLDWQLPNEKLLRPFAERVPIHFIGRTQNVQDWAKLPRFWNETTEQAIHPVTGEKFERKAIKIKLPLGIGQAPFIPAGNDMSLDRWLLGRKLYFDPILSSDNTVSCASCHDPSKGWTDQAAVSIGIGGKKGGVSAPTVLNTAYNVFQFWDGRAMSLEDQAQGPVANNLEMFAGDGHAWNQAVLRVRAKKEYIDAFKKAYGTEPTRDAIAKAIAVFERTVLSGNSVHDRAVLAMQLRLAEQGKVGEHPEAVDYAEVLNEAFDSKDVPALDALNLKDKAKVDGVAKSLASGVKLFFGKARCNSCHVGDNFTDNQFHNLGVGVKDGKIPPSSLGRFAAMPIGAKDPNLVGAFKTPTLRGLIHTGPYMHDGSEKTLEEVVEFYDKGGNPNRYLDIKMRDENAEKAFRLARKQGKEYGGQVKVHLFGPDDMPIAPLPLKLTDQEKKDLVLFMRALQGDPIDPLVADPERMPTLAAAAKKG